MEATKGRQIAESQTGKRPGKDAVESRALKGSKNFKNFNGFETFGTLEQEF